MEDSDRRGLAPLSSPAVTYLLPSKVHLNLENVLDMGRTERAAAAAAAAAATATATAATATTAAAAAATAAVAAAAAATVYKCALACAGACGRYKNL